MPSFASNMQMIMVLLIAILMVAEAFMGNNNMNNNKNNNNHRERPVKLRIHRQAVQKVKTLIPKEDLNNKQQRKEPTWLLQEYMQLPAAQYACVPLPINGSLERVHGSVDEFTLQVPPIRFPISTKDGGDIEIIPKVRAKVTVESDKVIIQSISCSIEGSPAVEEWKLNDRYDLDVSATLTWEKQRQGILHFLSDDDEEEEQAIDDEEPYDDYDIGGSLKKKTHPRRSRSNSSSSSSRIGASSTSSSPISSSSSLDSSSCLVTLDPNNNTQDVIRIKTDMAIDVYPPNVKRIKMIPKRLLSKIGNMVMKYVLGLLLEAFLEGLQQDYEKWACDGSYRKERKLLEHELQVELDELAALERKKLKQEERQQRRQRQRQRREDDSGDGGGNGNTFPSFNNLQVGFLQRRRASTTATAATATQRTAAGATAAATRTKPNLRRGERIIRLIRRNNQNLAP
ncbi:unnamed protein product [Cylindrotheca closterium]|uniref:Uncharacterized protein n=1 Tax=Cylindrotheca closterium TaxID=2856 RepID=A0AAD2GCZ0_9STRA|nr:unnamed protein product [Cylindrotheca closterium]